MTGESPRRSRDVRRRTVVASIICGLGVACAVVMWQSGRPVPVLADRQTVPVLPEVERLLDEAGLDYHPTEATVGDCLGAFVDELRSHLAEARWDWLSEAQSADLVAAAAERIEALLLPSFERDFGRLQARGDPRSAVDVRSAFEGSQHWFDSDRLASVGVKRVQVRLLSGPGQVDHDLRKGRGFASLSMGRTVDRVPVPSDPIAAGWAVVEVVFPLSKELTETRRGEAPRHTGRRSVVLGGWRLAWSKERKQWIPYESILYRNPNNRHVAVPMY